MKTKFFIPLAAVIFSAASVFAGEDVPAAVKTKFASEYSAAKKVKWEKEEGKFEAHFILNGTEMSATYDAIGNKLETETEIETSALPKSVSEYVSKNYAGHKIKEAAKIVDATGTVTYEAELKSGDFIFDSNGNFLNKKEEKDDDDDDDDDEKENK